MAVAPSGTEHSERPTRTEDPVTTRTQADTETIAVLGGAVAVRVDGTQTGGDYSVVEQLLPGGMATPLHLHRREDETFVVLEGDITVLRGDETIAASAGDVVRLPRGVPHAFRVDSDRARLVDVVTPAGHEQFFRLAGEPTDGLSLGPPAGAPDMDRIVDAAARTDLEILGPPPFEG